MDNNWCGAEDGRLHQAEQERDQHLASVVRQTWNNIQEEYVAGLTAKQRRSFGPYDMVAVCCDYIGLHYGTAEDAKSLVHMSDEKLAEIGNLAGFRPL